MKRFLAVVLISFVSCCCFAEVFNAFFGIDFGSSKKEVSEVLKSEDWTIKEESENKIIFYKENGSIATAKTNLITYYFLNNKLTSVKTTVLSSENGYFFKLFNSKYSTNKINSKKNIDYYKDGYGCVLELKHDNGASHEFYYYVDDVDFYLWLKNNSNIINQI